MECSRPLELYPSAVGTAYLGQQLPVICRGLDGQILAYLAVIEPLIRRFRWQIRGVGGGLWTFGGFSQTFGENSRTFGGFSQRFGENS